MPTLSTEVLPRRPSLLKSLTIVVVYDVAVFIVVVGVVGRRLVTLALVALFKGI